MLNLKKWSRALLALTLVASTAALQAREMVSVAKAEINMRAGAGTQHEALWALSRGYPLEVTGRQGKWLKVRDFENDSGWVYRPLVGNTPHVVVKSRVANVRSAPNTRSRILGKADHGEVLRTLEHRNDWVRVQREGGLKGWIARRLLWGW
jgi:SH3-like domain-containing protein